MNTSSSGHEYQLCYMVLMETDDYSHTVAIITLENPDHEQYISLCWIYTLRVPEAVVPCDIFYDRLFLNTIPVWNSQCRTLILALTCDIG